jgi:hypothetical protein
LAHAAIEISDASVVIAGVYGSFAFAQDDNVMLGHG